MSNWVKFSDRMPTKADADIDGNVMVLYPDDSWCLVKCHGTEKYQNRHGVHWLAKRNDLLWLESVPRRPHPRTLEDVVREYLNATRGRRAWRILRPWQDLRDEMREILERIENE